MTREDPLSLFDPLIEKWFVSKIGTPTSVQKQAWPAISTGENVLVTAPTGSGKTLTAFLWAIDQLARRVWEPGRIRVLYISPLRALNNDIKRNLVGPLGEIGAAFADAGRQLEPIRVMTRSGDTTPSERSRMLRRPPEILVTTPESLNIMLTSKGGREILGDVETVILDEIHAVAGGKRGTHLISAVERLVHLSGEFQRIALSATVHPLERVARWVGGYRRVGRGAHSGFEARPVRVVDAQMQKDYDVRVIFKPPTKDDAAARTSDGNPVWVTLAKEAAGRIRANRSTLVFANSRRSVEKVARLINGETDGPVVYAHHGSLSREIREVVEQRLKAGELAGIVATNSLELGIDIGAIDEVLLLQAPPSIAAAIQRIGRAGHQVGATSSARLYPTHRRDLLNAAVVVEGVYDREVEPINPPKNPLDVLAQILLSMTAFDTWKVDDLFDAVREAEPYAELPRRLFDLVVDMLAGRYGNKRLAQLKPRIAFDRIAGTVRARPGVPRLIYSSGGTIPDRGYFKLRLSGSNEVIGELDEEFIWERSIGDVMTLGVQTWRIERISHSDVFVSPSRSGNVIAPFWRSEELVYGSWMADRVGRFLEWANDALGQDSFEDCLRVRHRMNEDAVVEMKAYLREQKNATGAELPHRGLVLVEHVGSRGGDKRICVIHCVWGGKVNRPLAFALQAALEEKYQARVSTGYDDTCVAVEMPDGMEARELFRLVPPERIDELVRKKLELTGLFGAHFRQNAGRALLLPKSGLKRRTPFWVSRERSKALMDAVSGEEDFPILLETWRSCFGEEMETDRLRDNLESVRAGTILIDDVYTSVASPFASQVLRKHKEELMYADDKPTSGPSQLRSELVRQVVHSSHLRPRISPEFARGLEKKLQRTAMGYAPATPEELVEWVLERLVIPAEEWGILVDAVAEEIRDDVAHVERGIANRVVRVKNGGAEFICALEDAFRLKAALSTKGHEWEIGSLSLEPDNLFEEVLRSVQERCMEFGDLDLSDLISQWLRSYGPIEVSRIGKLLGVHSERLDDVLSTLCEDSSIVMDLIEEGSTEIQVCDSDNLARLLRGMRVDARPSFETLPVNELGLFLANRQGLGRVGDLKTLQDACEKLAGVSLSPEAWEQNVFPARMEGYLSSWLDGLMTESDLIWYGAGEKRVSFCFEGERELFSESKVEEQDSLDEWFPKGLGRFTFGDIISRSSSVEIKEVVGALWRAVWDGAVTNDSFASLRRGIESRFAVGGDMPVGRERAMRRRTPSAARWKMERPFPGNWYRLESISEDMDAVERDELERDRVRILLARYGVVFRELLQKEVSSLVWSRVFRALRVMELGGEVVSGRFFEGPAGLQFASTAVLSNLREGGVGADRQYWMNAADPASLCGLGIAGLEDLPARKNTTYLAYCGKELLAVGLRNAKVLDFRIDPDDPRFEGACGFLDSLLGRGFRPLSGVDVELINDESPRDSIYRVALERRFDVLVDHRGLRLARRRSRL